MKQSAGQIGLLEAYFGTSQAALFLRPEGTLQVAFWEEVVYNRWMSDWLNEWMPPPPLEGKYFKSWNLSIYHVIVAIGNHFSI